MKPGDRVMWTRPRSPGDYEPTKGFGKVEEVRGARVIVSHGSGNKAVRKTFPIGDLVLVLSA